MLIKRLPGIAAAIKLSADEEKLKRQGLLKVKPVERKKLAGSRFTRTWDCGPLLRLRKA